MTARAANEARRLGGRDGMPVKSLSDGVISRGPPAGLLEPTYRFDRPEDDAKPASRAWQGNPSMPQPELLIGAAASHFDEDGNMTDAELRASLVALIEALRAWTVRLRLKEVA
jgi:hypothetical protein